MLKKKKAAAKATNSRVAVNRSSSASAVKKPAGAKRNVPARKRAPKKKSGRHSTDPNVRTLVWIRAAGHCELCGDDLTVDLRIGAKMRWGEVAHLLPASSVGPRAKAAHDDAQAKALTNELNNLLLACPSCHTKIDKAPERYAEDDLLAMHRAHLAAVRHGGRMVEQGRAAPLIVLGQAFATRNAIGHADLLGAMFAEGLSAVVDPEQVLLPEPSSAGRDAAYWAAVADKVRRAMDTHLRRNTTSYGDPPVLAIAGLADIPALMMLGQIVGDRMKRKIFSPNRETGLRWPDAQAKAPDFVYMPPPAGDGPLVLVLSLSAKVPHRDVAHALPGARIAEISIAEPSVSMVKNRGVVDAFREALQKRLSELESSTSEPIHVFAAIPAALAIEFGAFLTMLHRHPYTVYDRDGHGGFQPALTLGHP